jgi:hypothetical protein
MERIKIATRYSSDMLEINRPQTLSDQKIESLIQDILFGKLDKDITDNVYINFKREMFNWISSSKLNKLTGFEKFDRIDICSGCTQFIDTIYMNSTPQFLQNDYMYHNRLGNIPSQIRLLKNNIPLILAMPFPSLGNIHPDMKIILDECLEKNIPVHIDGAWVTCSRNINFDLSHPAINSISISLSKGLGLGWNRIGLRWSLKSEPDAITLMNDFHMNNRVLTIIGLHFLRNLSPDYLWNTHQHRYLKICKDFNLVPTNSIHIAMLNNSPVGVSPLIRYLEEHENM